MIRLMKNTVTGAIFAYNEHVMSLNSDLVEYFQDGKPTRKPAPDKVETQAKEPAAHATESDDKPVNSENGNAPAAEALKSIDLSIMDKFALVDLAKSRGLKIPMGYYKKGRLEDLRAFVAENLESILSK